MFSTSCAFSVLANVLSVCKMIALAMIYFIVCLSCDIIHQLIGSESSVDEVSPLVLASKAVSPSKATSSATCNPSDEVPECCSSTDVSFDFSSSTGTFPSLPSSSSFSASEPCSDFDNYMSTVTDDSFDLGSSTFATSSRPPSPLPCSPISSSERRGCSIVTPRVRVVHSPVKLSYAVALERRSRFKTPRRVRVVHSPVKLSYAVRSVDDELDASLSFDTPIRTKYPSFISLRSMH